MVELVHRVGVRNMPLLSSLEWNSRYCATFCNSNIRPTTNIRGSLSQMCWDSGLLRCWDHIQRSFCCNILRNSCSITLELICSCNCVVVYSIGLKTNKSFCCSVLRNSFVVFPDKWIATFEYCEFSMPVFDNLHCNSTRVHIYTHHI